MKVVIYTANAGGYDICRPQVEQEIETEWVYLTDSDVEPVGPWHIRPLPDWTGRHPRMVAKRPRMRPRDFFPDADFAIWIDANMSVTNPRFAHEAILDAGRSGMAIWKHPQRQCIYAEARASLELAPLKYADQPIEAQVEHYRSQGYPENAGLYAAGTIAWDLHSDRADEVGWRWLAECDRWSYQDQISFPFVARQMGIRPRVFRYRQIQRDSLANPWLTILPHCKET